MKASVTNDDLVSQCRGALAHFWTDTLKVETAREGVNIALPLLYPDGRRASGTYLNFGQSKDLRCMATEQISDRGLAMRRRVKGER